MKTLNLILALLIAAPAFASDMPEYLKDAKITVTLKNGKTVEFSANEYKVVPRVDSEVESSPAQVAHHHDAHREQHPAEHSVNRVTVLGGVGPRGLSVVDTGTGTQVSQRFGAVLGVQYSRKVSDRISISGAYISNDTAVLGVGLDF